MAVGVYRTSIKQNGTWRRSLVWCRRNEDGTAGDPYDLSECSAHMQIRARPGLPVLCDVSTDAGGITIDGPAGLIVITIGPEQTALLTGRRVRYDLFVTFPSRDVIPVLEGQLDVDLAITAAA